jgi:hypothetical protein
VDTRVEKLLAAFQRNGWLFVGLTDTPAEWWFSELFHLTSIWRPVNTNLYLALLNDPQNIKEKIIWSVSIAKIIPNDRHFSPIAQLTLNDIKRIDLDEFVKQVNKIVLA